MSGTLDYFSLVKMIKEGRLKSSVFLFYGPERHLADDALRLLADHYLTPGAKDFNLLKLDARDLDSGHLSNELNGLPIFSDYRVVVVDHAEKYFASNKQRSQGEEEVIARFLDNPNSSCCLVFIMEGKPDKRKNLFKKVLSSGQTVEFAPLKEAQLSYWLKGRLNQNGKRITEEALNYLITSTVNNLSVFQQELEKLFLFAPEAEEISLDMVRMTVSRTANAGIFDLVDAVGEKKTARAVDLLREMLIAGEPPVYILFMIARQYRLLLSVKSLLSKRASEKQVQSKLSLHPFVFKKLLAQAKNFEEADLRKGLKRLLEADVALKNSFGNPGHILEMAILKISS